MYRSINTLMTDEILHIGLQTTDSLSKKGQCLAGGRVYIGGKSIRKLANARIPIREGAKS